VQAELIEASDRQRCENADALMEHPVRILECKRDFGRGAFGFGWIGNAPMCRHRLAGPDRTDFARRVRIQGGPTDFRDSMPGVRAFRYVLTQL